LLLDEVMGCTLGGGAESRFWTADLRAGIPLDCRGGGA
jgi:hypothetical protein